MLLASSRLKPPVFFACRAHRPSFRSFTSRSAQAKQERLQSHVKGGSGIERSTSTIDGSFFASRSSSSSSVSTSTSTIITMASSSSSSSSYGTLFLGGGNAAGYFAAEYAKIVSEKPELKDSAFGGSLAIVGDEPDVSYERPALSKAYLSPQNPARLPGFHSCVGGGGERQDVAWYESRKGDIGIGIDYVTGARAVGVDAGSKAVTLADGRVLSYEKLVIATGARPVDLARDLKMPGALTAEEEKGKSSNVFYLRNRGDADRLYAALLEQQKKVASAGSPSSSSSSSAAPRPLVIGGGYIGLELAAALVNWGLPNPLVVFPESRILERVMTAPVAEFYRRFYELKGGVEFRSGASVTALERGDDGRVSSVKLSDGTSVSVSLVVVGVGARPEVSLFEGGGGGGGGGANEEGEGARKRIELADGPPGGVLVDARLRSVSAPDTWAVGDVAAFPSSCLLFGGAAAAAAAADAAAGAADAGASPSRRPTRQEHVQHARASAAFAARDIVAASSPPPSPDSSAPTYRYLPYYYSRVFDLSWVFYGRASSSSSSEGEAGAETAVEFGESARAAVEAAAKGEKKAVFGTFHLDKGRRIVGVFLEAGSPEDNAAVKKLVEGGASEKEGLEWASERAAKL